MPLSERLFEFPNSKPLSSITPFSNKLPGKAKMRNDMEPSQLDSSVYHVSIPLGF